MKRRRQRGLSTFAAGVVTIVLIAVGVYFGFTKAVPFQHHFTIHAAFTSANNVKPGSPVRIAGVNVGKVSGVHLIQPAGPGQPPGAIVDMRIDGSGLPIHKDATVAIRPRIFLEGNWFVDVHPGSPSAPTLGDGDTIPVNQTSDPVQLDQVLSVLKTATRSDLQQLLQQLSIGFSGRGAADFNRTIQYQEPAYRFTSVVNDAFLGTAQHDLSNFIASSGAVAAASDASPQALQSLITDFNTTAGALAAQDANLQATIRDLPQTLNAAMPALQALNNAFPHVQALARDFDPAVRSSLPAVNAAIPFIQQLRGLISPPELEGLVNDLRPTVPALAQLNVNTTPLLEQARAASACQNNVILPWSHSTIPDQAFPATGPVFQDAVKWLPADAAESRAGDANGQNFRVLVGVPNFVTPNPYQPNTFELSMDQTLGTNPPAPATLPTFRPDVSCETQLAPNLATIPGGPPPGQTAIHESTTAAAQAFRAKAVSGALKYLDKLDKISGQRNVGFVSGSIK